MDVIVVTENEGVDIAIRKESNHSGSLLKQLCLQPIKLKCERKFVLCSVVGCDKISYIH